MSMNELIVKYKVARCSYMMLLHRVLSIFIIFYLQFTKSKRAISIRYILIMNIISMKDIYGYYSDRTWNYS